MMRPFSDVVLSREFTDAVREALGAASNSKVRGQSAMAAMAFQLSLKSMSEAFANLGKAMQAFEVNAEVGSIGILHVAKPGPKPLDLNAIATAALSDVPHWKPVCCSQPPRRDAM